MKSPAKQVKNLSDTDFSQLKLTADVQRVPQFALGPVLYSVSGMSHPFPPSFSLSPSNARIIEKQPLRLWPEMIMILLQLVSPFTFSQTLPSSKPPGHEITETDFASSLISPAWLPGLSSSLDQ